MILERNQLAIHDSNIIVVNLEDPVLAVSNPLPPKPPLEPDSLPEPLMPNPPEVSKPVLLNEMNYVRRSLIICIQ